MLPYVITAVVSILIAAIVVWLIAGVYHQNVANSKIGSAEEKAREIIQEIPTPFHIYDEAGIRANARAL